MKGSTKRSVIAAALAGRWRHGNGLHKESAQTSAVLPGGRERAKILTKMCERGQCNKCYSLNCTHECHQQEK